VADGQEPVSFACEWRVRSGRLNNRRWARVETRGCRSSQPLHAQVPAGEAVTVAACAVDCPRDTGIEQVDLATGRKPDDQCLLELDQPPKVVLWVAVQ
jgi:hypothetical protein